MTIDSADRQYESNLESDVRFKIESNHEASQVPMSEVTKSVAEIVLQCIPDF